MPNRKISRGPPDLVNIIFQIADIFRIKDFDYTITLGCDDVDDYINSIYKVLLKGYREGQKIKKAFIVKLNSDPKKRTAFRNAYQREFYFYRHIVPKLLELQRAFKVIEGLKIKFPNCIFATVDTGKEAIVVTDPQVNGYKFHDRFYKLDLDHVALAVKNLAKLHALSFALKISRPEEFKKIKNAYCNDVQYSNTERMSKSMISFYNASVNVVIDSAARKMLQERACDIFTILNRCVMPDTCYKTICHGDYWENNILFKYQKHRPVEVIFVDTQLARYASPVTDISYYLYMSTDHEFRLKYYDQVINLYYVTLAAVIRQCNLDISTIYPERIFKQHLLKYSVFGLIEALISMKIITAVPEEALKMMEVKHEFSEDESCEDELLNRNEIYVERVNGVVNDFFAKNYSLDAVLSK